MNLFQFGCSAKVRILFGVRGFITELMYLQLIPSLKNRLTYKVGAPIPITGVQFGMRVEFGYDCLIPADFNNDVSFRFGKSLSFQSH